MQRNLLEELIEWKNFPQRKPLLLYGARQVGKTYLLKEFAKTCFSDFIYLNFEDTPLLKRYFVDSLDPQDIIFKLSLHFNQVILPQETFIIFDEIQECPEALNSLKYFNEKAKEYVISACGSLLGVKMGHKEGFPVGQVNFKHLYPLSFMEFLTALQEVRLVNYLADLTIEPLPEPLHIKLNELLKIYYFTGGMPEAVLTYANTRDFNAVRSVHNDILKSYNLDFSKHADKHLSVKISEIWNSIPSQLAKENKKFMYSIVRASARAREYEEALQWLNAAGLVNKIHHVSVPKFPLTAYADLDIFKLYFLDVGLLNTIADLPFKILLEGHQLFQEFKGALTENYVFQALSPHFEKNYYWTSPGTAEIDGILQQEGMIFPLEIKSNMRLRSRSLQVYNEKYAPQYILRSSMQNLKKDGKILNIPLYLIGQIKQFLSQLK